jgi:hypothetical protein
MTEFNRRALLQGSWVGLLLAIQTRTSHAALSRGLSLEELTRASHRTLLVTPLESWCSWTAIGGRRAIVTDTRVRVDERLGRPAADDGELLIRTLGGVIGELGERFGGQAEFRLGHPAVVFLTSQHDLEFVTGMAQGHYPLRRDERGVERLSPSPNFPKLQNTTSSAWRRLKGADLPLARRLISEALR